LPSLSFWSTTHLEIQSSHTLINANMHLFFMEREGAKRELSFIEILGLSKYQTPLEMQAWLESAVIYEVSFLASSKWPG